MATKKLLKNIKKDIEDFFSENICANNANICIVGAIDKIQAEDISQSLVSFLPKGKKIRKNLLNKKTTLK